MLLPLTFDCPRYRPSPILLRAAVAILFLLLFPAILAAQSTNPQEITARDVPAFKLQSETNLVRVRAIVRDGKGQTVDSLHKEDFQLFDNGKPQSIVDFSVEKPVRSITEAPAPKAGEKAPTAAAPEASAPAMATRFLAIYFDDLNTSFQELARARAAADKAIPAVLQPGDRVALFTSSAQNQVQFTSNAALVRQALLQLQPRSRVDDDSTCDAVPPYEAHLIVDLQDPEITQLAVTEYISCLGVLIDSRMAETTVRSNAMRALTRSDFQSAAALRGVESVVRGMTTLPGDRSIIVVSSGFLTHNFHYQLVQIAERALRSGIVINGLDARGLYTDPTLDAGVHNFSNLTNVVLRNRVRDILLDGYRQQADVMVSLAHDTGGIFYENDNDLEAGFRKTAGFAEAYYLLVFSPPNLKHDGAYHPIKVRVAEKGLSVQARRGYYAPKKSEDPTLREKEEIRDAVFSRDDSQTIPLDIDTQFFMKDPSDARVSVLTSIDLHPLHFRKEEDRNVGMLLLVTVLFDQDGHEVSAQEKTIDLRMRDATLERFLQSGITVRSLFDVRPGTYLVREVLREPASGQLSSLSRTVEIPYQ
jgi:VWFA-related protein